MTEAEETKTVDIYLHNEAAGYHARHERLVKNVNQFFKDRRFRIISDYNGQPIGTSRPSMRGREYTCCSCYIDDHYGVCLDFEVKGIYHTIPVKEVEFV